MPDGRRRSREGWADAMEDGPPAAAAHTHRLPPVIRIAVVGLTGAVALVLVALTLIGFAVYQADQYVKGRGEYRDQETARLEEQIRQAQCDLLDTFPAGVPALERARAKYQCGPGIPVELLTPEEQARVAGKPAQVPTPPLGSPAVPNVERPEPAPVPERTGPGPTDAPPPAVAPEPLVDLRPIADPLCDVLGLCV